jgi:hypothetical protein
LQPTHLVARSSATSDIEQAVLTVGSHTCGFSAVFKFLLAQPELGLVDITKAQITLDSVRLNYVHGIWYEVSAQGAAAHQQQL